LGSGNGESLSPSKKTELPKVEAADETPIKPVSILDRYKVESSTDKYKTLVPKAEITQTREEVKPEVASKLKKEIDVKAWEGVKDKVLKSSAYNTKEYFNKLTDVYAKTNLDEDQQKEYNFIKNLDVADKQINEFNKALEKGPNPIAQFGLNKALALKQAQEVEYTKYKEQKYRNIDQQISEAEDIIKNSVKPEIINLYKDKIQELKSQKENFFLDENQLIAKEFGKNKQNIDKFEVPGATPKEKLQNYYLLLQEKEDQLWKQLNPSDDERINDVRFLSYALPSVVSELIPGADKDLFNKWQEVNKTIKAISPAVLINRNPVKDVNEGFFESFGKSAAKVLVPSSENYITTPAELSNQIKQSISLAGIPENTISTETGKILTTEAKGPETFSNEWWGNIAGTSAGMIPYFAAGTELVKGLSGLGKLPVYQRYLEGTKYGKYLVAEPVQTGIGYKAAGYIMPSNSDVLDEATFLSGFFGGVAQSGINKLLNTKYTAQMFNKLFGEDAERMAVMVSKVGNRVGSGLGEYAEEVGNTVGTMIDTYMKSKDFSKLKQDFTDNFGTMDKNLELFVASFTMGAIMSSGTGYGKASADKSKDFYANLSAEDKKKADSFVQRVTQERYNAMVAAKKAEIKEGGAKAVTVTQQDLNDKQDAINVLSSSESSPQEKSAALSVLADVNLKIDNSKITKAAEAELATGNISIEVKPEDAVMEPVPSAEGTIVTKEGTVEPAITETIIEAKPLAEGDQVQLEPQIKGGMPRIMEFKDNTWQQKVGNEYTTVSKEVQQEAQNLYDSQNKQRVSGEVGVGQEPIQTKPIEGGRQEAPSPSGNVQAPQEVEKKVAGTVELKSMEMANKNVSKFLQDSDIDVNILDTQEAFDQALKDEGQAAERGTEGAFVGKSGKIFINKSALGKGWAKTILYHEATHPVINIIRNTNPAKYKALVNGVKELAKTNQDVKEALDWTKDQYEGYPEGTIEDEGIVEVIARVADGKIKFGQIEPTLREKIVDFINQIAKAIGLPPITSKTDTETFKKTARQVANAMRKGKSISKVVGKENVGQYKYKAGEVQKSAVKIMEGKEKMSKYGLKGDKAKTREVGKALEERQRQKYGTIDKNDRSVEARKKISSWMVEEIKYFTEAMGENSGKGWYGEKYQKGLDAMAKIFPEMKSSKNARDLFTMLVAITSDGEKVLSNFRLAAIAYSEYIKNGKKALPTNLPGMRQASFASNLAKINSLLKEYKGDIQKIKTKLLEVKPISEINKERRAKGEANLNTSWPAEFNAPLAASIFGPKLGMFYSNLSGKEDYPTLDRWWSRTFNRYRGNIIPQVKRGFTTKGEAIGIDRVKELLGDPNMSDDNAMIAIVKNRDSYADKGYKNGTELEKASNTVYKTAFENLNDSPENKTDRLFMYEAVSDAVNKLNAQGYDLTIADAQAILWYFEKNLYKTLGVQAKIEGISYEEAANATVEKFKQTGSLDYKINKDEDVSGLEEEDDLIEATETQLSKGGRQGLETSEKEITFAQDETRKQKGVTPRGQRVDRQVGSDSSQMGTESSRTRGFQRVDSTESRRLGGRTVRVSAIYKPTSSLIDGIKSAIPKATIDSEILEITSSPEEFHRLISNAKAINEHGASVFVYEDETTRQHQYDGMRLFITPDGKAGLALKPNGDLVSGFNTKDKTKPNRLPQLILLAIKEGATKTDAFNTVLPDYYSKFGFRAVAKSTFNDEFAPKEYKDIYGNKQVGWDYDTYKKFQEGRPDVVYFVYDGGDRATIQDRVGTFEPYSDYENIVPLVSDPDEGAAMQDKAMGKAQASKGGRNLAPNGKPSNLNDVQYKQVRTPEFKAWFGDWENDPQNASKIVDENGEPRVVYTGTSKDKDFDTFKLPRNGAWFTTDPQSASEYAVENDSQITKFDPFTGYRDLNTRPRVIPVFLNIRKPGDFIKLTTEEQRQKISYSSNYRKLQGDTFKNIYFENEIGNRYDGLYYTKDKSVIVVIESPNQIKSAIGNSGKFSPISDKIQFSQGGRETVVVDGAQQRVASVPDSLSIVDGFYSPIEKRITEFKQPKASATKWKEIVGSKSDEAVFSGIADWLNTFKPDQQISKEEVQNFIKNNRVEIKQVIKADNWREFYNERMAEIEKETEYFRQKGFDAYTISRTPDEMFDKLNDADQDRLINLKAEKDFLNDVYFDYGNSRQVFTGAKEEDMPKYIKYINRGDAQNYKEILVTAPSKQTLSFEDWAADYYGDISDLSEPQLKIVKEQYNRALEGGFTKQGNLASEKGYKSSHYNEKNIVVHTRTDVRRDSDDNKIFFIEEVQSDWGQEGLKKGFKESEVKIDQDFLQKLKDERKSIIDKWGSVWDVQNNKGAEEDAKRLGEVSDQIYEMVHTKQEGQKMPYKAPYVTNTNAWTKLGLKIALQQAVKEGADKIAWTTGEQQNKRYDLSKQVDAVTYEKNNDGTYNVDGIKNNRSISYKENVQADQLESMLGKDVAERIINDQGDTYFDGKYMGGVKVLTGDQLTVGGKGMTAFYGNMETPGILGNVAKALVKELTGVEPKIEGTALGYSLDQEDEVIKTLDEYDNSLKKGGIFYHYGEVLTKSQALDYIERGLKIGVSYPKADVQPSIVITPELRAAVEKGMPQFSRGERGVAADTEKVFDKATDLFYKIKGTEGSAKRKAFADERKALMDKNPSIKFIDDNIKKVLDQLESKEVATRKGNCP